MLKSKVELVFGESRVPCAVQTLRKVLIMYIY